MNRIWAKCNHGIWLSPCPICKEENNNNSELKECEKIRIGNYNNYFKANGLQIIPASQ